MKILFFIENPVRDFYGYLYLSILLKAKGVQVILHPAWLNARHALKKYQPDIAVLGQVGETPTADIGRLVKESGAELILLTTETVCPYAMLPKFFKHVSGDWNYKFADKIIIPNKYYADFVSSIPELENSKKYCYVGTPRFDLNLTNIFDVDFLAKKYELTDRKAKFLFVSDFIYDETVDQVDKRDLESFDSSELTVEAKKQIFFIDFLKQLASGFPNEIILIKPHPWDKTARFSMLGYDNIRVISQDCYISPLLELCEYMIHERSTTAIEAWMKGVPTISITNEYDVDKRWCHLHSADYYYSYDQFVNGYLDYDYEAARQNGLAAMGLAVDGESSQRFVGLVTEGRELGVGSIEFSSRIQVVFYYILSKVLGIGYGVLLNKTYMSLLKSRNSFISRM